jgi:hypothetical protein
MYTDLGEEDIAPYIFDGQMVERKDWTVKVDVALSYALDFYNYVFVQTAPVQSDGEQHLTLAPSEEPPPPPPHGISTEAWNSWISWSNTIRGGVADAPSLCDKMAKSEGAYIDQFVTAIEDACQQ